MAQSCRSISRWPLTRPKSIVRAPNSRTQYRSAIFTSDPVQNQATAAYIAQLDKAGVYSKPISTRIEPLVAFYPAEPYHQDYTTLHPENPYIAYNDLPKIANLSKVFPALYRAQRTPVTHLPVTMVHLNGRGIDPHVSEPFGTRTAKIGQSGRARRDR